MLKIELINFLSLHIYLVILLSLFNSLILILLNYNTIKIWQLNGYSLNKTYLSLKDKKFKEVGKLLVNSFLSFSLMLIFNIFVIGVLKNSYFTYISIIFYLIFSYVVISNNLKANSKNKLVVTKRMIRFLIVFAVLNIALSFSVIYLGYSFSTFTLIAMIGLTPILSLLTFVLACLIVFPIEELIKLHYKNKAKNKIKNKTNLKIIGITGSYGKTSVKNILFTILSEKYNVEKTPNSFNTEMGICKTINEGLNENADFLILEMGADKLHDIKKLCKIACPTYSILTGINNQHLKTFKTIDNIIKTKYELIENTKDDGICVFNAESEEVKKLFDKTTNKNKYLVFLEKENENIYAKNIKTTTNGTTFEMIIENNAPIVVNTKLLGKHNVQNILLASFLCYKLGLNLKEINNGISKITPTLHRLELIKNNDLNIIDDSFNSNKDGAKCALEVFKEFPNSRIVITPGLVELGEAQQEENIILGEELSNVADYVIIVNKINRESLIKGLEKGNFNKDKIFVCDDFQQANLKLNSLTKPNDSILFLNDLPDNYE